MNSAMFYGRVAAADVTILNNLIASRQMVFPVGAWLRRTSDEALLQVVAANGPFTTGGLVILGDAVATLPGPAVLTPGLNPIVAGVITQAVKAGGTYTLQPSDSGTIIPVTGAVTVTVDTTSLLTAPVELRRWDAATLGVTATGVTLYDPKTAGNWGTLQVTGKLQSILIDKGSSATEYLASKLGV